MHCNWIDKETLLLIDDLWDDELKENQMRTCKNALLRLEYVQGGCTTEGSFHPLFTSKDSSVDLPLNGVWESEESDSDLKAVTVTRIGEGQYTMSITTEQENTPIVRQYSVALRNLGEHVFYDATFDKINWKGATIEEDDLPSPPIHFLGMVIVEGDNVELMPLDGDWLHKALEDKEVQITYEREKGTLLLTAKTEDLQKFVRAFSEDPKAFPVYKFHRRK